MEELESHEVLESLLAKAQPEAGASRSSWCIKTSHATTVACSSGSSSSTGVSSGQHPLDAGQRREASVHKNPVDGTLLDKLRFGPFRKASPEQQQRQLKLRQARDLFAAAVRNLKIKQQSLTTQDWKLLSGRSDLVGNLLNARGEGATFFPSKDDTTEIASLQRQRGAAWLKIADLVLDYERLMDEGDQLEAEYKRMHGRAAECPEYRGLSRYSYKRQFHQFARALQVVPDDPLFEGIYMMLPTEIRMTKYHHIAGSWFDAQWFEAKRD